MKRFVLILFFAFTVLAVFSQNTLSGRVLDSLTRKPLPYVNVFFANTTTGTVTDTTGFYIIRNIPTGKYDLTFSFVGYKTIQQPIDFSGAPKHVTAYLAEQVVQLKEVYVRVDTANWKSNFRKFKGYFLGTTQNASRTTIMNPRDIRLYYDNSDKILTARAKRDIEIENQALGYKIYYQLVEFMVDYGQERMTYLGIPRFEQLTPKNERESKHWEEERRRAYYGSFSHFIKSFKQNELEKNGFEVFTSYKVNNNNRPPDAFINEKIRFWLERSRSKGATVIVKDDSLSHYYRLRSLPKYVDSVGHKITDATELLVKGTTDQINFKGMLQVTFKNEREERNYAPHTVPLKVQLSVIHFTGSKIKIYDNGYWEDIHNVFFEGYMGWSEKISDLLPLGYVPAEE